MELRPFYDIEIFIDEGYQPAPEVTAIFPVYPFKKYGQRRHEQSFAVTLHEFGNSPLHFYQYFPMRRQKNVIVSLHDLTWSNTLFNVFAQQGKYTELRQEIASMVTPIALTEYDNAFFCLSQGDAIPMQRFLERHYLLGNVVSCSHAQLIRLDFADELTNLYPTAKPYPIPHTPKPFTVDKHEARQRLGIRSNIFMVGVFGYVARIKRVDKALIAFNEFGQTHPNSQLVIVGPFFEEAYQHELEELITPQVVMAGFVEQADYEAYMAACDVVIGLRWPWSGESSRVVNQAVGAGKPIIITDLPKWADYPAEFAWRVPINEAEIPKIVEALNQLADDSALLRRASVAAQQWFNGENRFATLVAQYRQVIDRVIEGT